MTWRGDLGSSTGALGVLDSRGQEGPIGIGTGHRSATDFSNFSLQKGGRKVSRVQVDDTSPKAKEYLGFEVLEGEVGDSFYGSKTGSTTVLWWSREAVNKEGSTSQQRGLRRI